MELNKLAKQIGNNCPKFIFVFFNYKRITKLVIKGLYLFQNQIGLI